MSSIILPCQGNQTNLATRSIKEGQRFANSAVAGGGGVLQPAVAATDITGATVNTPTNANDSTVAAGPGSNYVFSIPLMNGLLGTTQDKLVPLFLLNNAPIVIEITLQPSLDIGCWGNIPGGYTINDVRYMASLVETGPAVEDQIRQVQAQSGGRLVLNGVDYTHHPGQIPSASVGRVQLDIPVRKKSIKSVLFVGASGTYGAGAAAQINRYNLSYGGNFNMSEYQLAVGSRRIPEIPIGFQAATAAGAATQKAQYFEELVMSRINNSNQSGLTGNMAVPSAGGAALQSHVFCPFGIDCEAFQPDGQGGGALESGVDTATGSLPLALMIDIQAAVASNLIVDMYVVHDSLYFIDQVGNLRVAL